MMGGHLEIAVVVYDDAGKVVGQKQSGFYKETWGTGYNKIKDKA